MILVVIRCGLGINMRLGPLVGTVNKGKADRCVRTRSRNRRERWIVLTPDCRDSAFFGFQFLRYGVHVGERGRVEREKYDALRIGFIRLLVVWRSV